MEVLLQWAMSRIRAGTKPVAAVVVAGGLILIEIVYVLNVLTTL